MHAGIPAGARQRPPYQPALLPREAPDASSARRPASFPPRLADLHRGATAERRPQRRLLAVCSDLHVARAGRAEPVDRHLGQAVAGELEEDDVNGVGVALGVKTARGPRRDRLGELPVEVEQQVEKVHASLEERPVGHGGALGDRLVPRREIHELPDLAKTSRPTPGAPMRSFTALKMGVLRNS
jgi:hypothetical protein